MATSLKRLQVRVNDDLLAQVRQLQQRLSLTDSAVGSLLIATGMRQFEQLGLVKPVDASASPVEPVVPDVKLARVKSKDAPKDDAPLGFRTKQEHEDEHEDEQLPIVVRRAEWTGYMSGL